MKTPVSIFTKITLSLLVAGTLAACNSNKTEDKKETTAPAASTAAPVDDKAEIVFVNQDTLLSQYQYVKDMTARLETKGRAAQNDVGARQQAIQREVAEYQRNANTMSADQRAATEQRLQRKSQEFQQYSQNAGAQVQNEQGSEQVKLYEKISDFMKAYAKEKGYKMILTYQKGNATMLYGDPSLDVTGEVVKRLNDAYTKDKK
ncbi:OmpH family outer membrane protein [Mucilaginibacter lacusdianchii]|uniref:OmpH family outer membrane protein n=1 Tax=Mucilaginibacter lacusdianchii TaxID=2684211 RepID=UPI00131BC946|nr:OmpH family outer membrane protein [Mucilaginibacter sp. JXJ CY 39]